MKSQRGYTFLEVLIVLSVIGIILAITSPAFMRIPGEKKELVQVVLSALRDERVEVHQLATLRLLLSSSWDDRYTRALKEVGVTDKQIEVLRSGKLKVKLEP